MTVNILGSRGLAYKVGKAIATTSSYLQHPVFLDTGIPYVNPHYMYSKIEDLDLRHLIGMQQPTQAIMYVVKGIEDALTSLDSPFRPRVSREEEEVPAPVQHYLQHHAQEVRLS